VAELWLVSVVCIDVMNQVLINIWQYWCYEASFDQYL